MKPPIDAIRLTSSDKDALNRAKRNTGVSSWNVLCRWALIIGLLQKVKGVEKSQEKRDAIEIRWDTFAGQWSDALTAFLRLTYRDNYQSVTELSLSEYLHASLSTGIRILAKQSHQKQLWAFEDLIRLKSPGPAMRNRSAPHTNDH